MSSSFPNHSRYSGSEIQNSTYGWTPYALILIALSILCFIGAFIQNGNAGKVQSFTFNPGEAEEVSILEVERPNTIYAISVYQSTSGLKVNQDWSDVSVTVRSEKDDRLMSFGSDFWRASGYDDGAWSETKNRYTTKATFPLKGQYKVSIESNSSKTSYNQPVSVTFQPRRGSTIPLLVLGIPALIAGVLMGYLSNRHLVKEKLEDWS